MGRVVWSKQLVVRWPFLGAPFVALLLGCVLLVDLALGPGQRLLPAVLQGLAGLVLLAGAFLAAWWSKQLRAPRWPFLAALFAALLVACVLPVFPGLLVDLALRAGQRLVPVERVKAVNDVRTTLLQGIAGLFLLAGAYATWRQLLLSREGQITDRFTKAIDQLDSTKSLEVRLGAIYALERIARDSERDHWPIMEVLTACVRQHAPWPPKEDEQPGDAEQLRPRPAPDIQAILTILGRRTRTFGKGENQSLDLRATDLRGADLCGAHLEGARLWEAHLEGAVLESAHLDGANLLRAHLERADLLGAHLQGAHFIGAVLEGAHLGGADLWGAIGLTWRQIESAAIRDENTQLPDYLAPPPARRDRPRRGRDVAAAAGMNEA